MRIALYGKIRAGKGICIDTFRSIVEEEGYSTAHIEFSDPVCEVVEVLYPRLKGIKDRETYIRVAQHLRELDKDIWVNCIKEKIQCSSEDYIFVGGVRQPNEYKALKEMGFVFIEIVADEGTRLKRCIETGDTFEKKSLNNITENYMDSFESDFIIFNNGTKEQLAENVQVIFNRLKAMQLCDELEKRIRSNLLQVNK